ncbi:MAG: macro domain-containing protein [Bacteroidales bacterium]
MKHLENIDQIEMELLLGDIAEQTDISAVVNAANAELQMGGGVAGALHRAAGPELAEACRPLAPIKPGQAVITKAYNLPNDYVIHCLGPVYGRDKPEDKLLADCYRNTLHLAEQEGIESVAFPSISTGAFGYPVADAAAVAIETIKETIPSLNNVQRIRMVLFSEDDYHVYEKQLTG